MGSSNLSSKKKSLSSIKKKRVSKKSSQVRKRKRSRSRKRDKSRKRLRRDIPVDDLRNEDSVMVLSSDSEDDCRHRKGRSRIRGDIKGSKKRVRRSFSSGDDSSKSPVRKKKRGLKRSGDDSIESPVRKKKRGLKRSGDNSSESPVRKKKRGLKRTDVSKEKKKSHSEKPRKKGSRRDVSVESGSRSCSTCGGGSSSDESEVERSRGSSKGRGKGKRSLDKTSDGNDRYSYRSRSLSSSSVGSEGHYFLDRFLSENNSRRLKSVVAVPNELEEGRYQSTAEDKPEIIQAYDDCPSCKSNDSYDAGRKKESSHQEEVVSEKKKQVNDGSVDDRWRSENSHQPHVLTEKKRQIDNGNSEDALTSKTKTSELTQSSKEDAVAQCGQIDCTANTEPTKVATKDEISSGIVSSEVADLESILRQKALENFIKFRGKRQAISASGGLKVENVVGVKQSSTAKDETLKSESVTEADRRVFGAKETVNPTIKNINTAPVLGDPMTNSLKHGIRIPADNAKQVESSVTMCAAHPSLGRGTFTSNDSSVDTKGPHKKNIDFGAVRKSSKGNLIYIRESSGNNLIKQAPKSHDCSDAKSEEPNKILKHNSPEPPKAAPGSSIPREVSVAPQLAASEVTSGLTPATGDQSLTEPGNAARGGSEFEQKTMSVMRGGEMVQAKVIHTSLQRIRTGNINVKASYIPESVVWNNRLMLCALPCRHQVEIILCHSWPGNAGVRQGSRRPYVLVGSLGHLIGFDDCQGRLLIQQYTISGSVSSLACACVVGYCTKSLNVNLGEKEDWRQFMNWKMGGSPIKRSKM
ncbi:hypothetical protein IFM89_031763 [Coptis chinensis]|uniref:Uncharacterized protein n=1 Tax=Coptis chinensis TaxID=261450 RepID=A0A835GZ85_9MAGN|nr:hypothetical protein IFM89_031763 [Coptis chinensis]